MKTILFIALIQSCLLFGCSSIFECGDSKGAEEYKKFVRTHSENLLTPLTPESKALRDFSAFSVEQQIDVYLYAMGCPNNPQITKFLAYDGERKVQPIVNRIKRSNFYDKGNLVYALIKINEECRCITKESIDTESLRPKDNGSKASQDSYREIYEQNLRWLEEEIEQSSQ
ncbi:MAG: hypothetical protein KIS76_01825 [Pyrinomonadaceae bacterium]|nr:hypothetical protein [Pyrinomonadaceae bacterium]